MRAHDFCRRTEVQGGQMYIDVEFLNTKVAKSEVRWIIRRTFKNTPYPFKLTAYFVQAYQYEGQ